MPRACQQNQRRWSVYRRVTLSPATFATLAAAFFHHFFCGVALVFGNYTVAIGIDAIEHPFRDAQDADTGRRVAETARADGFTGMVAVHPAQVPWINSAFAPLESELSEAFRIVAAFRADPDAPFLVVGDRRVERSELQRARRLLGED